eukprot:273160-Prymnesium_polylepis.1
MGLAALRRWASGSEASASTAAGSAVSDTVKTVFSWSSGTSSNAWLGSTFSFIVRAESSGANAARGGGECTGRGGALAAGVQGARRGRRGTARARLPVSGEGRHSNWRGSLVAESGRAGIPTKAPGKTRKREEGTHGASRRGQ